MFKKMTLVVVALIVFAFASSARANFTGCKIHNFIGTFNRVVPNADVWGDGTAIHTYIYSLQLHIDGTATQMWSGTPDFLVNGGTTTDFRGSWLCRSDGKLVVTTLVGQYVPVTSSQNPNAVTPDVQLDGYLRNTMLFSVDSDNALTRVQLRNRVYGANEDPTNPTGGHLGNLFTNTVTYNRFVASDADLLLP